MQLEGDNVFVKNLKEEGQNTRKMLPEKKIRQDLD